MLLRSRTSKLRWYTTKYSKFPVFIRTEKYLGLLLRSRNFFGKKYVENGETQLSLSLHGVKPWFNLPRANNNTRLLHSSAFTVLLYCFM